MSVRSSFVALMLVAGLGPAHAADDAAAASAVAKGFYGVYATFQPSDGIPNQGSRARLEPYLSPALVQLLSDAEAAEKRFAGRNKDAPPLIEGDLFTSNFEGATSFSIGKCESAPGGARCAADLGYDPKDGRNKPVDWTDRLYLIRTATGWRIDDIGYGANATFGNKGRLSDTLKEAIRDGGT